MVLSTAGKYALAMIDAAMEGRWASKGTYVFYLELVTDMLHLFVYLIFFFIVFANYGLPLHLVRLLQPKEDLSTAAPALSEGPIHCIVCTACWCVSVFRSAPDARYEGGLSHDRSMRAGAGPVLDLP